MVRKLAFATCVISALAVAAPAQAQLCTGQPSFSSGPVQVSPGAAFTEGATEFGGSVVGGSDRFFGGAGLFRTSYSDIDEGAFAVAGLVGSNFVADANSRVNVCPLAVASWQSGPNAGDLDIRTLAFGAGGQVGIVAADNGRVAVVPTFGASIRNARLNVSFADVDETVSETFGLVNAGVGFIFNHRLSVNPVVSFPIGLEEGDMQFSVGVSLNFGGR